jgi:pyruvate ferredoxin oxidoreductase gamma subunit
MKLHSAFIYYLKEALLMSKDMMEIRWHGRGGQGAKTAALLLGEAAIAAGKYVQAFPEYGPERMGAPVAAYDRIASKEITIHSPVLKPDVVLVLDETLIESVDMVHGLSESEGVLIVNTPDSKEETKKRIKWNGSKLITIDASKIAQANIGRPIPNTPMIGALIGATLILPIEAFMEDTKKKLEKKFKSKPEVIEGNLKAIRQAYEEVKK